MIIRKRTNLNEITYAQKAYQQICMNLLLPLGDRLSRQCVMQHYAFFQKAQWWSREQLASYQNELLRHTIRTAYNETLFYKKLLDKYGIKPSDISTVGDLNRLPVVTKDMLRQAYPRECTRKTNWPYREYHTSGSTGKCFTVRVDNYSMSIARALMLLRTNFSGWNIGDRCLQTGMTINRDIIKKLKDVFLRISYVSAFNLSDPVIDRYLEIINDNQCHFVMGYAASLYLIAKRASEVGFNYQLRGVVSWGDNMFTHYRNLIEKQFKCKVTDSYGCGEGIQVGAQCGCSAGSYHLFMPHVVVEFTHNGQTVPSGELGDILLTRLDPGAMPLIRYSVGDVGRGNSREECACGRGLEMMKSIDGRAADIILTPNGNRLIVHFFTGIFEYAKTIDTFQVVQETLDEIIIRIVTRQNFHISHWEPIEKEIKKKGGYDLNIKMEIVRNIPLEKSNKRRFVISRINK